MNRDFLILYVNGRRHEVSGARAFQSLSDFLRNDLGLVGTKIVCSEGDCGSCSILLGRRDTQNTSQLAYRSVCSCIHFLHQLDCRHVITVEGLKYDGQLNPVQQAMVKNHGSQCGFCTPGFVVSMCAMFEDKRRTNSLTQATPRDVKAACVGNLCRCTGYEAILKAGTDINASEVRPLSDLHSPEAMITDFVRYENDGVLVSNGDRRFFKAGSLADAIAFRTANRDCTIIAGGTDVGVWVNKGFRDPKVILSIGGLDELRSIEVSESSLSIGALASLSDMESITRRQMPEFADVLKHFGSPPIRNAGTIGGNVANGSPIGDSMPAYFVLNAEVELVGTHGSRRVNINSFYTGYKKTVATPDELLTRIILPIPKTGEIFKLYKISRRKDLDISSFTAAIWMRLDTDRCVADSRIAFGGVGPNILRMRQTEDSFVGKALTAGTIKAACKIARSEIAPISDVRGSAAFRLQLGENILRKFYAELFDEQRALRDGNGWHPTNGQDSSNRATASRIH